MDLFVINPNKVIVLSEQSDNLSDMLDDANPTPLYKNGGEKVVGTAIVDSSIGVDFVSESPLLPPLKQQELISVIEEIEVKGEKTPHIKKDKIQTKVLGAEIGGLLDDSGSAKPKETKKSPKRQAKLTQPKT